MSPEDVFAESGPIRLTQLAKRAGCAAKQPPGYLLPLLGILPAILDPNVLVGSNTADDAAVYKLSEDLALVLTTDFFTPIVDRPYDFGAVAAANALSDVYAMGGRPIAALSLVGFPDPSCRSRCWRRSCAGRPTRPRRRASRSSAATRSNPRSPSSASP
jgi:selenium donor protein